MNELGYYVTRIEEEHLWEAKQLGAHSPQVLLNTLVYFNTKYFMLRTVEDHQKLSFTHIMKHWKKAQGQKEGQKSVILRYYPPAKKGMHITVEWGISDFCVPLPITTTQINIKFISNILTNLCFILRPTKR